MAIHEDCLNQKDIDCLAAIIDPLCRWFSTHAAPLPFRDNPTPYHVWLSEIMLQQTRIEAVKPYYHRFIAEIPDVPALAAVDDDRLMKLWQGLGYYSRAVNLKKAARLICDQFDGELPADYHQLLSLPGIGAYTAGAIASIAFHLPEPAVDGNVLRVVMRLLARYDDVMEPHVKDGVGRALRSVYPSGDKAALLTEGLMELGERVCLPKGAPLCDDCPLSSLCRANAMQVADALPIRIVKIKRRTEEKTVLILFHEGRYAIEKRPEKGLLGGLFGFPMLDGYASFSDIRALVGTNVLPDDAVSYDLGDAKHVFTHITWLMKGYAFSCARESDKYLWVTYDELINRYAIPTAFHRFLQQLPL